MAKQVKLAVQNRADTGRSAVKKIKSQGFVPAVIYSHNETPAHLQVAEREITNVMNHAAGEHILVDLSIDGGASRLAIIKEVQHHPVSQRILHVDFHGVSANQTIEASIPVEPVGEAAGVKSGGILEQLIRQVNIKTKPKDLPELITVDVSDLNIGDSVHIKDLKAPEGVTILDDGELGVIHIAAPKVSGNATETAEGDKEKEKKAE